MCNCKSCSIEPDIRRILTKNGIENEKLLKALKSYIVKTVVFFDDMALDNEMIVANTRDELDRLIKSIDRHGKEWDKYFTNKRKYRPLPKFKNIIGLFKE